MVALRLGLLRYHGAGTAVGATFEFVAGAGHGTGAWRWRLPLMQSDACGFAGARVAALHGDIRGAKGFYRGWLCVRCDISESIIMTMRPPTTETRSVLRTILSAGMLAVLVLACAAAGATWVVDDDDGGADSASIRTAEAAA